MAGNKGNVLKYCGQTGLGLSQTIQYVLVGGIRNMTYVLLFQGVPEGCLCHDPRCSISCKQPGIIPEPWQRVSDWGPDYHHHLPGTMTDSKLISVSKNSTSQSHLANSFVCILACTFIIWLFVRAMRNVFISNGGNRFR